MVVPFPRSGRLVEHAYRELHLAATGTEEQVKALGDLRLLPRPWDPATCLHPELHAQVWQWLEHVVVWLNGEYVWDVAAMVPPCWPRHPHLVHEIAVLADQRRRAGLAISSDDLEEWHRYALPAFVDRTRTRLRSTCEDKDHQPWPAVGRHTRHTAADATRAREAAYRADVQALTPPDPAMPSAPPRLHLVDGLRVDPLTGEVTNDDEGMP
jgi:hypothetical protein